MGIGHQDALPQIVAQPVHHAEHHDQRRHTDRDAAGGDDGVERAVRGGPPARGDSAGRCRHSSRAPARTCRQLAQPEGHRSHRAVARYPSVLRPHGGKEDHVADRRLVGEEHHQPVDAQASPPAGGMPYSSARM